MSEMDYRGKAWGILICNSLTIHYSINIVPGSRMMFMLYQHNQPGYGADRINYYLRIKGGALFLLLTLLLLPGLAATSLAQTTWTGLVSSDWNTAANWSTTAVPGATDHVVVPSGTINVPVLSTTAVARTVEVQSGASFTITSAGRLSSSGDKIVTSQNGAQYNVTFFNGGTVVNLGTMVIGNTASFAGAGLWNVASFSNLAGAGLTINLNSNFISAGIVNEKGSFVNSAAISIGSTAAGGQSGISNFAVFSNLTGGSIAIDRTSLYGIYNLTGSFVNQAAIRIGTIAAAGTTGFYNQTTFSNLAGGSLTIDRTATYGIDNGGGNIQNETSITIGPNAVSTAINNGGTFNNQGCTGLITSLGNGNMTNTSSFSNTGTIIESSTGTSGISYNGGLIQNLNGGSFTVVSGNQPITTAGLIWRGCVNSDWNTAANWSAGTLPTATDDVTIPPGTTYSPILSTTAVAKSVEVQSGASFTISNSGSLTISGAKSMTINSFSYTITFFNSGTVVNQGALSAGNTAEVGLWNESSFSNLAGGSMTIDGTSSQALANNAGTFVNQATIRIGSLAGAGRYGIRNSASFTNTMDGLIQIDNTTVYGMLCQRGSFVNSATLTIGSIASTGFSGLLNSSSFTNKTGGFIDINLSNNSRLVNEAPGTFVNQATITIGSVHQAAGTGLTNASSFSNIPGGSIIIYRSGGNALTNNGSFLNAASIAIGTLPGAGLFGLVNSGSFSNVAGGNIAIDRISGIGLINDTGLSFVNSATITIGTLSETALAYGLSNSSSFSNLTGGSITIDHATTAALSHTTGIFFNLATINIGASTTGFAISNGAVFNNQGCQALINSLGNAIISSGSYFFNTGTIIERSSGNSSMSYNGGLVQNLNGGTFAITTGQPPLSVSATGLTTCNPANGSFTIAGVQPATAYTLSYTVGNTTASLTQTGNSAGQLRVANLSGGTYALALSGSCVAQTLPLSATLGKPAAFTLTTQPPATSVVCAGSSISAAVGVSGTTGPVAYQWYKNSLASPVTSQTAAILSLSGLTAAESGSYSVVITDNCTSTTSAAFSLTVNPLPSVTVTAAPSATLTCTNPSLTLTAQTTATAFAWNSNNAVSQTLPVSQSGVYALTVTDGNGCTATSNSLTISQDVTTPSVSLSATGSVLTCSRPQITLTATASTTALRWSNGQNTLTLPVSQSGVYTVTATGANGCTALSNNLTITQDNNAPTVSLSATGNQLTCTQPQLTLTATASVTALRWSTGETTQVISVSTAATYSVTATGANGCPAISNNQTIGQNFSLPPVTVSSATVCPGQPVSLTAMGCAGQVRWSNGMSGSVMTVTAGSSTSTVTATCTTGICATTAAGQIVIGGVLPLPAQILSFTADETSCPVKLTGRGVATSFTMTGPKDYVFSTVYREGAMQDAVGLNVKQAGTYTLTATYTNSCGTSEPVTRTVTVGRNCP